MVLRRASLNKRPQTAIFTPQGIGLGRPPNDGFERFRSHRLRQKIERAELHRVDGRFDRSLAGEQDDFRLVVFRLDLPEKFNARHTGHGKIKDGYVVRPLTQQWQRELGARGPLRTVTKVAKVFDKSIPQLVVVVHK